MSTSNISPLRSCVIEQIYQRELKVKEKQAKFDRLNQIKVYKKIHNVEQLLKITLQNRQGARESLLDLAVYLRARTDEPLEMSRLLDNIEVPHNVIGYNEETDEFID